MTDSEILTALVQLANKHSGGHVTIMKFTTNWRVDFTTPEHRNHIQAMSEGKTLQEAAFKAVVALYDTDVNR